MTERDAFGNPIPERQTTTQPVTSGDPLGASTVRVAAAAFGDDGGAAVGVGAMGGVVPSGDAMGGGTVSGGAMGGGTPSGGATATATAAAARAASPFFTPTPTPVSPPPPAPAAVFTGGVIPALPDYGPSKRSALGRVVGLFMVLLFVAPFAIGGLVAYNAFHTAKVTIPIVKSIRDLAPANPSNNAKPTAAPTGVTGASMLRAANLDRALRAARRDPGGHLGLLRVAPARADLQLARKGGGLDLLQLTADGGRTLVQTPGTAPSKAISFSKIDTKAPARLVRAAAKRLHRAPAAIDYVVLLDVLGGPRWSAYFTGGAAFQGDAHGHVTRRIQ